MKKSLIGWSIWLLAVFALFFLLTRGGNRPYNAASSGPAPVGSEQLRK